MQAFSKDELLALLGAARAGRERDWLMMAVAFNHGLRASEVVALTPDHLRDGLLDVQRLKGSNRTVQPLIVSDEPLLNERDALIDWTRGKLGNQRIFPIGRIQFWRLMRKYGTEAGIPEHKLHPHTLKHSIAMQTIHSAGIENVRQYLGHKSIASTGAYLKVDDAAASSAIGKALSTASAD